jgi:hypothetical protein
VQSPTAYYFHQRIAPDRTGAGLDVARDHKRKKWLRRALQAGDSPAAKAQPFAPAEFIRVIVMQRQVRRRTNIIPHAFGESLVPKLMYAAVIRAADR